MTVRLGEGFMPTAPFVPAIADASEAQLSRIEWILAELSQVLSTREPPPEVHVDAVDLTQIVEAVNGLKPGADADDIAEAVARAIHIPEYPVPDTEVAVVLKDVAKTLETLDFRLQGTSKQGGGGGVVSLALGSSVQTTPKNSHTLFDYSTRTDGQQIYLGKTTLAGDIAVPVWTVTKSRYESAADNARLLEMDVRENIKWTNRTNPVVDSAAAWTF